MLFSFTAFAQDRAKFVTADPKTLKISLSGLFIALTLGFTGNWGLAFAFACAVAALVYGIGSMRWINAQPSGNGPLTLVDADLRQAAQGYLRRQCQILAPVVGLLFVALGLASGWPVAFGLVWGVALSGVAAGVSLLVALRSNSRTAQAAQQGGSAAFTLAFRSATVAGALVAGLGLLGVTGFYAVLRGLEVAEPFHGLLGLALGSALVSVWSRLGGGCFAQGADQGAERSEVLEAGLAGCDPRNPATLLNRLGESVGDCAGTAGDLFESYVISLSVALWLGSSWTGSASAYPLVLAGIAIISLGLGIYAQPIPGNRIGKATYQGLAVAIGLSVLSFYPATLLCLGDGVNWAGSLLSAHAVYFASLIGLAMAAALILAAGYHTGKDFSPVRRIAQACQVGPADTLFQGLAESLKATVWPALSLGLGLFCAHALAGLYGMAVAATSMLSLTGMIVALAAFAPIASNAEAVAEMAGLPEAACDTANRLNAAGNSFRAPARVYATGAAGLVAWVLLAAGTASVAGQTVLELSSPLVLVGLLLGGIAPYGLAALTLEAAGRATNAVVNEVRRQFREIPGIMAGRARPDYSEATDRLAKTVLSTMLLPLLLVLSMPLAAWLLSGRQALGGIMVGTLVTGLFMAMAMAMGGFAWSSTKTLLAETGAGSPARQAAATVGDPGKDAAGPALNSLIKLTSLLGVLLMILN